MSGQKRRFTVVNSARVVITGTGCITPLVLVSIKRGVISLQKRAIGPIRSFSAEKYPRRLPQGCKITSPRYVQVASAGGSIEKRTCFSMPPTKRSVRRDYSRIILSPLGLGSLSALS